MLYLTTKSTPQGALAAPARRPPCPGSLSCRRHGGSPAHPASLICFPTLVQGAGLWDRTPNPVAQLPSSRHLGFPYARPKPKVPGVHLHPLHPCHPRYVNADFAASAASLRCAWISGRSHVSSRASSVCSVCCLVWRERRGAQLHPARGSRGQCPGWSEAVSLIRVGISVTVLRTVIGAEGVSIAPPRAPRGRRARARSGQRGRAGAPRPRARPTTRPRGAAEMSGHVTKL